ncbi:NYN domain-containing protein [Actinoallomurus soli]|uniref:NYN domain-containing protein n=1 Tax=Actinoallomurus soli TaxID=2952535 RepID=UPI002092C3D4|nr:NYN domain-containing protein [Actinoallomurus soli]MCO5973410.1 NYN domain-containing protein [Actinoallomurus soli]
MADNNGNDQVALFIDLENLSINAKTALPGQVTNPVPYKVLEGLCRRYGHASIRRAYADWSKPEFARFLKDLDLNGIDPIQVVRLGAQQKNAVDIHMSVDVMEVLFTRPEVTTFLLATGDSDYAPLVKKLRGFGKHIVGIGTEASASNRLIANCSEYKYWGTLVAEVDPVARATIGDTFPIAEAKRLVLSALEESATPEAKGAWLKSKMRTLDPSFDEKNYECRSFREFLGRLEGVVTVTTSSHGDMIVTPLTRK